MSVISSFYNKSSKFRISIIIFTILLLLFITLPHHPLFSGRLNRPSFTGTGQSKVRIAVLVRIFLGRAVECGLKRTGRWISVFDSVVLHCDWRLTWLAKFADGARRLDSEGGSRDLKNQYIL